MGEVKTVEREMTDRERALAVLLEIAEDGTADAATRLKAADIVLTRHDSVRRPRLSDYTQQAAQAVSR